MHLDPSAPVIMTLPGGRAVAGVARPELGPDIVAADGGEGLRFYRVSAGGVAHDVTATTATAAGMRQRFADDAVAAERRHTRAMAARVGTSDPLDFRSQHDPLAGVDGVAPGPGVEPVDGTIADAAGGIGAPAGRVVDVLQALRTRGEITDDEQLAGEQFQRAFAGAQLDPLRAADMKRGGGGAARPIPERVEDARQSVSNALARLGGVASAGGAVVFDVLGLGYTLKEHAERTVFGAGRSLNATAAKGRLVAALGVLAAHYGYTAPAPRLAGCGVHEDFEAMVAQALADGAAVWGRREAAACAARR